MLFRSDPALVSVRPVSVPEVFVRQVSVPVLVSVRQASVPEVSARQASVPALVSVRQVLAFAPALASVRQVSSAEDAQAVSSFVVLASAEDKLVLPLPHSLPIRVSARLL